MRAIIHDFSTQIFPTDEEVKRICRPGVGADTCVWLTCGAEGFECVSLNRPHTLLIRWEKGETHAKRDGCEYVNSFDPVGLEHIGDSTIIETAPKEETCR